MPPFVRHGSRVWFALKFDCDIFISVRGKDGMGSVSYPVCTERLGIDWSQAMVPHSERVRIRKRLGEMYRESNPVGMTFTEWVCSNGFGRVDKKGRLILR